MAISTSTSQNGKQKLICTLTNHDEWKLKTTKKDRLDLKRPPTSTKNHDGYKTNREALDTK